MWYRVLGILRGDWLHAGKNEVLATYIAKEEATYSLPHLDNKCQQSVNDFWSHIVGNLSGT
jgi:hypothetical protein